jgi:hypothetical protein
MKHRPSSQSNLAFLFIHVVWMTLFSFCMLLAGCFMPRDHTAWSDSKRLAGHYPILPVFPSQVRITVEASKAGDPYEISMAKSNVKNQEEVARIINEVLDTIAAGEENALEGPGKIDSALKLSPHWKNFQVYIQDPGPFYERWKREGLATISRDLGYQRVLYVNPTLLFIPNFSLRAHENEPLRYNWDGRITVTVDMMDLANVQVIASGAGEADFYGDTGVVGIGGYGGAILIPYAFGKAFDRAVDQSIRQALADLLAAQSKGEAAK